MNKLHSVPLALAGGQITAKNFVNYGVIANYVKCNDGKHPFHIEIQSDVPVSVNGNWNPPPRPTRPGK